MTAWSYVHAAPSLERLMWIDVVVSSRMLISHVPSLVRRIDASEKSSPPGIPAGGTGFDHDAPASLDVIVIDVTAAHFWDISGVGALDKIVARLRREGRAVEVIGYNRASADLIDRFALHDKTGVELGLTPH